jgi:hypothetical protein
MNVGSLSNSRGVCLLVWAGATLKWVGGVGGVKLRIAETKRFQFLLLRWYYECLH